MVPIAYTWINSRANAEAHPKTWHHPSESQFLRLKEGDYVQVGAEWVEDPSEPLSLEFGAERFWAKITSIDHETKTIKGVIDNDLIFTALHGLEDEDEIEVSFDNVIKVWIMTPLAAAQCAVGIGAHGD